MNFKKEKNDFLTKKDKSRKGSIDNKIKKLVDKINSLNEFYTTSSCSGRVLILAISQSNKKNEVKYLFRSHKKIKFSEINKIINKILLKEEVWFKVQPVIMHIASTNINNAIKLLNIARDIGFRRSGIISIRKNKITLELVSTEIIETIISKNGKLLIDEDYLKVLVIEGNGKLEKTWKKIDRLDKEFGRISFI